ncbi:hypothetical protein NDI76_14025 [Halogeometricum sp. S1BR25-6]|uniref:Uncharacterized protein n=1 Tax=Halogeometricum salsisoli TaxID=2950536 RepID=A0ABU2GGD2_9EURY|nr:hypothetical protein [Halogeometricum sp. S1BR25-6]MDS0299862.1 hypothetical protein [Halogeometricum sp. S1BR25-6]
MDRVRALVIQYACVGALYLVAGAWIMATRGFSLGGALSAFGGLLLVGSGLWNLRHEDDEYGFGQFARRDWFFWPQTIAVVLLAVGAVFRFL